MAPIGMKGVLCAHPKTRDTSYSDKEYKYEGFYIGHQLDKCQNHSLWLITTTKTEQSNK